MGYALADIRNMIREWARNARDSTLYSDYAIDISAQAGMHDWNEITKEVRTTSVFALTPGSLLLPAAPTGFTPDHTLDAYLTLSGQLIDPKIQIVQLQAVLLAQARLATDGNPTKPQTGQPRMFGFDASGVGQCDVTPGQAYSLNVLWWMPETTWVAGTGTAASFNLPDDHLRIICRKLAPYYLQGSEPVNGPIVARMYAEGIADARAHAARGVGGAGPRTIIRRDPQQRSRVIYSNA
jgi:hypothetical protein